MIDSFNKAEQSNQKLCLENKNFEDTFIGFPPKLPWDMVPKNWGGGEQWWAATDTFHKIPQVPGGKYQVHEDIFNSIREKCTT